MSFYVEIGEQSLFSVFGDFSNSESNSNHCKEIDKVCLYVVWISKIGNLKESVKLSK